MSLLEYPEARHWIPPTRYWLLFWPSSPESPFLNLSFKLTHISSAYSSKCFCLPVKCGNTVDISLSVIHSSWTKVLCGWEQSHDTMKRWTSSFYSSPFFYLSLFVNKLTCYLQYMLLCSSLSYTPAHYVTVLPVAPCVLATESSMVVTWRKVPLCTCEEVAIREPASSSRYALLCFFMHLQPCGTCVRWNWVSQHLWFKALPWSAVARIAPHLDFALDKSFDQMNKC